MINTTINMNCDRCGRLIKNPTKDDNIDNRPVIFKSEYNDKTIEYTDLCDSCKKRLDRLFDELGKTKRPKSNKQ